VACDVEQGDEVVVTPYSFSASASCALMVDAKPVFCDIQDDIFCLDPYHIEKHLTSRTKAIIPVHLMGHPADMGWIMEIAKLFNLRVIEDSAQAIGAMYHDRYAGTIGDCGIFSFNQSKPISTGEGGVLITNDDYIARVARAVRNHGEVSDPELGVVGYNYRLCEVEAVLALAQFKRLDEMNDRRIELTDYMTDQLKDTELIPPVTLPDCKHVFYTYAMKSKGNRDQFQARMKDEGIYFGSGYVKPLYLLPVFGGKEGQCPVCERMYNEIIVTDIFKYPMTIKDVDKIIEVVKRCLR